jgi:hypothetical protein
MFISGSRHFFYIVFFVLACLPKPVSAQTAPEEFRIRPNSSTPITNSLYKRISFIDSRYDTSNMGVIHSGEFSNKAPVQVFIPFPIQLNDLLKSLIDETAADGELLFQLRKLKFAESETGGFEKGLCFLRANLYEKNGNSCKKLSSLDTVIVLVYSEVSTTLPDEASKVITSMISSSLTAKSPAQSIDLGKVKNIDHEEKFLLPLYNPSVYKGGKDTSLTNGVYFNYAAFKNLSPNKQIASAVIKPDGSPQVKILNGKNKPEKIAEDQLYAFVNEGKAYVLGEFAACQLYKYNDDFFYVGAGTANPAADALLEKVSLKQLPVPAGSLTADLLKKKKDRKYYLIRLDHIDGSFMRVKEIVSE